MQYATHSVEAWARCTRQFDLEFMRRLLDFRSGCVDMLFTSASRAGIDDVK